MKTLAAAKQEYFRRFYLYTCESCHTGLVISAEELEASTAAGDILRYTCCNCGHINYVDTNVYLHRCDIFGSKGEKFELSEEQLKRFKEFSEKEKEFTKDMQKDALGIEYEFSFVPGGLGDITKVKNLKTGHTIDLTDYSEW